MDEYTETDEWVLEGKFYISPEHDNTDMDDICTEGCDWCMSDEPLISE